MSVLDLDEFRAHLNVVRTVDNAEIGRTLDAAEAWVNAHTAGLLRGGSQTVTARSLSRSGRVLVLPVARLLSVDSLVDPLGATATLLADDWQTDLEAGVVGLPYAMRGTWTVTVSLSTTVPADVRLATYIVGKHLFETQRLAGQPESGRPGFGQGASASPVYPIGFAIPNRARELLAPYWLPGFA